MYQMADTNTVCAPNKFKYSIPTGRKNTITTDDLIRMNAKQEG